MSNDQPRRSGPEDGIALCLSGGGYRAMMFHTGVIWRLYDAGVLSKVDRISSVSGGSITAGVLGLAWNKLAMDKAPAISLLQEHFIKPLFDMGGTSIDVKSVLTGFLPFVSVSDRIQAAYRDNLFGKATLQDLPDHPRFVINATNVQTGVLWRFSKPYMRDYKVGEVKNPTVQLATAVTASSAFPPVLSPMRMELKESDFTPNTGELQRAPFTTEVVLTDGGVYDNLGLETAYKRYKTLLVSDAGGQMPVVDKPWKNWGMHLKRVLDIIDNQVRSLRKRQLIDAFVSGEREGAFWGIRTDIQDYELNDVLPCPFEKTTELAEIPTRLAKLPECQRKQLINWGYAVADVAIRKHLDNTIPAPTGFPYPEEAIGTKRKESRETEDVVVLADV